jgi:hypothetical protein
MKMYKCKKDVALPEGFFKKGQEVREDIGAKYPKYFEYIGELLTDDTSKVEVKDGNTD